MASPQITPNRDSFTFAEHIHANLSREQRISDLPESISTYENAENYDRTYRSSNHDYKPVPSIRESESGYYEPRKHFSDVASQEYGSQPSPYLYQPQEKRWFQTKESWISPSVAPSTQWAVEEQNEKKPSRWRRKGCFVWLIVVLIVLVGVGLGIGLWQGLQKHSANATSSSNTDLLIGGAIDPAYYSSSGAFNGSGIAIASASFLSEGQITLFFQHYTGSIRYMQLLNSGEWVGGTSSEIVASDARNGTPIAAVPYTYNEKEYWHMFYINQENIINERMKTNESDSLWQDGPIKKANLVANDADQVSLQAVWSASYPYGNFEGGMTMWYASSDTTIKQYGWYYGDDSWIPQGEFTDVNGHAGVGCYTWEADSSLMYVMLVNTKNTVEFYWKDTDTSKKSTAEHPTDRWTKTSVKIPNVYPATSLGYTKYFYAQMAASHKFNGYKISWDAENTKMVDSFTVDEDPGIPGTHLSVTGIDNPGGGKSVVVFYQTVGDDITANVRNSVRGLWTSADLKIPDS